MLSSLKCNYKCSLKTYHTMARGNSIYKGLTKEETAAQKMQRAGKIKATSISTPITAVGRNAALIQRRNEHICYRFVWYGMDGSLMFDWVIKQLCSEFYLTESTLGQLIATNAETITRIRREKLSVVKLSKKYPAMKW